MASPLSNEMNERLQIALFGSGDAPKLRATTSAGAALQGIMVIRRPTKALHRCFTNFAAQG